MDRWTLWQSCAAENWAPGWGDADLLGVALTFLYATATLLTLFIAVQMWLFRARPASRWLWALAAAYLLLLTVNKQLDLQSFLTATARCVARAEGWYEDRRNLQRVLTLAILIGGGLGVAGAVVLLRRMRPGNGLMLAGLALLTGFVALRILSFHHMDTVFRTPLLGLPLYRYVEGTALLLINWAAATKVPTA